MTGQLNEFFRKNWQFCRLIPFLFPAENLLGQVAVELEKANVLILGVTNLLTVVVNDVPDSCLILRPSGGIIEKKEDGHYYWTFPSADTTVFTLEIIDTCENVLIVQRSYRIRELSVTMLLGAHYRSKSMETGLFKAQGGIAAVLNGDEICGMCEMIGFSAQFFSKATGEIWSGYNSGARFKGNLAEKQQAVLPGDRVRFYQIAYRCPGMKQPRFSIEELFFKLK